MLFPDAQAQLLERRARVESLVAHVGPAPQLENLLGEIDAALARFEAGTYGLCDVCHEAIEPDLIRADPLARLCLPHLTPTESRALERDLELASQVQTTLLPPRDLEVGRWQIAYDYLPLGSVSGDCVDVIRPDDGSGAGPLVLLGDIAGKGVAASMLMAHLHASLRTLAGVGLPLGQVMARANRLFCESTMSSHFATVVCGRFGADGEVELINAGHCAPVLLQGGDATTIEATSVPVGLFCVEEFASRRVRLAPGDTLLLYTDGLIEAEDAEGTPYGVDRLVAAARTHAGKAPRGLVATCLDDLAAFLGQARRADDLTVMAIRRLD